MALKNDIIYCEISVGELLRRLNHQCVTAAEKGDDVTATNVARLSLTVEYALEVSGLLAGTSFVIASTDSAKTDNPPPIDPN